MKVEDFLKWESDDFLRYELVDGEPRAITPASPVHGFLHAELGSLIGNHLDDCKRNFRVLFSVGVVPHLFSEFNMRVPEIAVTKSPLLPDQWAVPEPILLVEVLAAGNRSRTWANVWTYTSIPSVQEILILYSDRVAVEVMRRSQDGRWPDRFELLNDGDLCLNSIGFRVAIGELYARTGLTA